MGTGKPQWKQSLGSLLAIDNVEGISWVDDLARVKEDVGVWVDIFRARNLEIPDPRP